MVVPPAFSSPPLVALQLAYAARPLYTVTVCLDEPLIPVVDLTKLVALCCIADVCIERVQKLPGSADSFDVGLLQQIETLCKDLDPGKPPQELLEDVGLLETFPYLYQGLSGEQLEPAGLNPGASYFNYISQLNQVVMIGTQLYHDATVPQHHKYCAHQIALLYQCLNLLQGDTKPVRRLVEARFDEIKQITESKSPILDVEISNWLQEITWLCREEIKSFPEYIHRKLRPMVDIVQTQY